MNKMKMFTDFKNDLVKNLGTDITLVPENQVVEFPDLDWENFYVRIGHSDDSLCPYCYLFLNNDCEGCPMYEVGNCCKNIDSTYSKIISDVDPNDLGIFNGSSDSIKELEKFVSENLLN